MQYDWRQAAPAAAPLADLHVGGVVNSMFGPEALIGFDPTIASGASAPPGMSLGALPAPGGPPRPEETTAQEDDPLVPPRHHSPTPAAAVTRGDSAHLHRRRCAFRGPALMYPGP